VEILPGVRIIVTEHDQELDILLAGVKSAEATISGEKSNWCWDTLKIVGSV